MLTSRVVVGRARYAGELGLQRRDSWGGGGEHGRRWDGEFGVTPTGGHGGSHGPLANEFITSILENRQPMVNVYEALAMTMPGIVAHDSALKDGETLKIPQYVRPKG